ncbi:MAG: biotin/lipoyl-binding protein [Scytonema sp. RU_4_4]|nr:biotin/lipoyl-binding protein [Scytonema sp. RU_4_4]
MLQNTNLEGSSPLKPIFRPPFLLVILTTIISSGIGIYTVQNNTNNVGSKKEQAAPVVKVTTVTALGRLEPKGEIIKLSAPTSAEGNRVEELLVREGTQVKQGQLVAILDSRDRLSAALAEAQEQVRVGPSKC